MAQQFNNNIFNRIYKYPKIGKIYNIEGIIQPTRLFDFTLVCKIIYPENKNIAQGTGFFYKINNGIYVVTNKHMICENIENNITYISAENNMIKQYSTLIKLVRNETVFFHPDNQCDLCMIKIQEINGEVYALENKNIVNFVELYTTYLSYMSPYPAIYMRGYTMNTLFPFNREGTLTSSIYEEMDCLLGDITSIDGYSGSPVFIKLKNIFGTDNGSVLFLGINKGYVYNEMKVFTKIDTETVTNLYCKENIRQNFIIKSSEIIDIEKIISTI